MTDECTRVDGPRQKSLMDDARSEGAYDVTVGAVP